jgi:hypothetical protein
LRLWSSEVTTTMFGPSDGVIGGATSRVAPQPPASSATAAISDALAATTPTRLSRGLVIR